MDEKGAGIRNPCARATQLSAKRWKAMNIARRRFLATMAAAAAGASLSRAQATRAQKILLRSSWQTVNIGDIAHAPGMLALLEKYRSEAVVTLWPNKLDA